MRSLFAALFALSFVASLSAGCARHGSDGEACSAPGIPEQDALGQCAAGFICIADTSGVSGNGNSAHWDTASCRNECASNADCTAAHTSCRTVPGAEYLMACQAD